VFIEGKFSARPLLYIAIVVMMMIGSNTAWFALMVLVAIGVGRRISTRK
jgi:hypothetical protein